eukprot:81748-Amphidinium_carterae.1
MHAESLTCEDNPHKLHMRTFQARGIYATHAHASVKQLLDCCLPSIAPVQTVSAKQHVCRASASEVKAAACRGIWNMATQQAGTGNCQWGM